jgi:hypothetical protein
VVLATADQAPAREDFASRETRARAFGPENVLPGVVERHVFQGPVTQVLVRLHGGGQLQAMTANQGQDSLPPAGSKVLAHLPAAALRALRADEPVDAGNGA